MTESPTRTVTGEPLLNLYPLMSTRTTVGAGVWELAVATATTNTCKTKINRKHMFSPYHEISDLLAPCYRAAINIALSFSTFMLNGVDVACGTPPFFDNKAIGLA